MHTKSEVIGAIAIALIAALIVLWYLSEHPAPISIHDDTSARATSTPQSSPASRILNETATYYEITASYPAATPLATTVGASADQTAVNAMKQFELDAIAQFKKDGNFANLSHDDVQILGLDQRKETLEITYEKKAGAHTVSYLYRLIADTLGAHPNTTYRTITFDSRTGDTLTLSDLFAPGTDYLGVLSKKARALLPATIAGREGIKITDVDTDYLNRGTAPSTENYQDWYIDGSALVLVFPPYQVAPYAAGTQVASIPLSQLSSLRSEYR